jgi:protein transport protein SEC61 subunit alpha
MEFISDPIHGICYSAFVMASCAILARLWLEVSGQSSKDIVKQIVQADLSVQGLKEESMISFFEKYIPVAASLGGIAVALLTITADMMGAIGSGTGILLAVNIIYQFFE